MRLLGDSEASHAHTEDQLSRFPLVHVQGKGILILEEDTPVPTEQTVISLISLLVSCSSLGRPLLRPPS